MCLYSPRDSPRPVRRSIQRAEPQRGEWNRAASVRARGRRPWMEIEGPWERDRRERPSAVEATERSEGGCK
jgi:hypothetical protein